MSEVWIGHVLNPPFPHPVSPLTPKTKGSQQVVSPIFQNKWPDRSVQKIRRKCCNPTDMKWQSLVCCAPWAGWKKLPSTPCLESWVTPLPALPPRFFLTKWIYNCITNVALENLGPGFFVDVFPFGKWGIFQQSLCDRLPEGTSLQVSMFFGWRWSCNSLGFLVNFCRFFLGGGWQIFSLIPNSTGMSCWYLVHGWETPI